MKKEKRNKEKWIKIFKETINILAIIFLLSFLFSFFLSLAKEKSFDFLNSLNFTLIVILFLIVPTLLIKWIYFKRNEIKIFLLLPLFVILEYIFVLFVEYYSEPLLLGVFPSLSYFFKFGTRFFLVSLVAVIISVIVSIYMYYKND